MKNLKFLFLLFSVSCISAAEEIQLHDHNYRVKKYAATGDGEKLLDEIEIKKELTFLLGTNEEHLKANIFEFGGRVDYYEGSLLISGCVPHQCSVEEAAVCIQGDAPSIEAAILSKEKIVIYSRESVYGYLSACIRDWVTIKNNPLGRSYRANNVRMSTVKHNKALKAQPSAAGDAAGGAP